MNGTTRTRPHATPSLINSIRSSTNPPTVRRGGGAGPLGPLDSAQLIQGLAGFSLGKLWERQLVKELMYMCSQQTVLATSFGHGILASLTRSQDYPLWQTCSWNLFG